MKRYNLLVLAFPRAWRERYQDELLDLVAEEARQGGQAFDLIRAGLKERRRTQGHASAGTVLALIAAFGLLLFCWTSTSPQIEPFRWLLTASFVGLLTTRRVPVEKNHRPPAVIRFRLAASFIAVAVGSTATIISSTASSHPGQTPLRVASAQDAIPAPPSIQSTLSAQVAATPGITAYLQSSQPKSIEWIDGKTVWVGTGNPTWTGAGSVYAADGHTLAGTYQDVQGSNNAPHSWPTESVAAATAALG